MTYVDDVLEELKRKNPYETEALIYKVSTDSDEIDKTDAENGEAVLYLAREDTEDMDPGAYNYYIYVTESGNRRIYEKGIFSILEAERE